MPEKRHMLRPDGIHIQGAAGRCAQLCRGMADGFWRLLYPPRCVLCDALLPARKDGCCPECEKRLPWTGSVVCMKCGRPIADESQEYCPECLHQTHAFDRGVAAFTYTGAMRQAVYRMKAANRRDYLPFFAQSIVRAAAPQLRFWRPEVILPVPMHPKKRRKRGYNQSELLAKELGRLTGIPVRSDLLRTVRPVREQKKLNRRERMQNLRGSIALIGQDFPYRTVLLADDVFTTGSTMDEIARVLKEAGAAHVFFVVICTVKGKKAVCRAEKL